MDITASSQIWNHDITGQFNGKPCLIIEGDATIIFAMPREQALEYAASREFMDLARAGIEVHINYGEALNDH